MTAETECGDPPATYEELQRGYEHMRDLCREANDGWAAERKKLWKAQDAIRDALRWLNAEGNTGTSYVNRIWGAKNELEKVATDHAR